MGRLVMPEKHSSDGFPSFEVWVERMKKRHQRFKNMTHGKQRDEYYKARESSDLNKKKTEEFVASAYYTKVDSLELSITELATIGLSVVNHSNFKHLERLTSMLRNPVHLREALNEFTEKMRYEFSEEIKEAISKKTNDIFIC